MARIIKTNGDMLMTQPVNGTDFQLDELKAVVNGWIEIVYLTGGLLMVVNEEGRLLELPINTLASMLAGQTIVGDVLVCKNSEIQ